MNPKLVPDLDNYLKKYNYTSSRFGWLKSLTKITYNNLFFVIFISLFILFLCYRYMMKKKLIQNEFKAVKIRNTYYEGENT
jgi:hypothetical protein